MNRIYQLVLEIVAQFNCPARTSQTVLEVVIDKNPKEGRTSQTVIEVLIDRLQKEARTSQCVIEILEAMPANHNYVDTAAGGDFAC